MGFGFARASWGLAGLPVILHMHARLRCTRSTMLVRSEAALLRGRRVCFEDCRPTLVDVLLSLLVIMCQGQS